MTTLLKQQRDSIRQVRKQTRSEMRGQLEDLLVDAAVFSLKGLIVMGLGGIVAGLFVLEAIEVAERLVQAHRKPKLRPGA